MKTIFHKMIQVSKVMVFCVSLVAMLVLTAFLSPRALAELDGRDSTIFADGINGKANSAFSADNADKLEVIALVILTTPTRIL
jgi:hypothetical protein